MRNKIAVLALLAAWAGCGAVKDTNQDAPTRDAPEHDAPGQRTLSSIAVTGAATLSIGDPAVTLTATATYDDATTGDVTATATWTSSTGSAFVNAGMVTAVTPGSTVITAAVGLVTGTHPLQVLPPPVLIATNYNINAITTYALTTNGNTAPLRTITGALTLLSNPGGLWVVNDEIFVANANGVSVFPVLGTGNIAPTRRIAGATTTISNIRGVTVFNNEIYVASTGGADVLVFPINANGDVAPTRTITGVGTPHTSIQVINGEIYLNRANAPSAIQVIPVNANGATVATRTITGANTGLNNAIGFYATSTELFVANLGDQTVRVWPIGADGDVAPSRTITGFAFPAQSAVRNGELFVSNYSDSSIRVFDVNANGAATAIRTITGALTGLGGPLAVFIY